MPVYGPELVVLHEGYEYRAKANGKSRVVIKVKSEPLIFNLDPKQAGKPVAAAIVQVLREKVAGITQRAADATLVYRQKALKAFVLDKPWAMKRYSGGKTGSMPPARSEEAFRDSGRFEKSIVGSASSDGAWRINVSANRLTGDTSRGAQFIYDKLVSLVPEFAKPELLMDSPKVAEAIQTAMKTMIVKGQASSSKLAFDIVRGWIEVAEAAYETFVGEFLDMAA